MNITIEIPENGISNRNSNPEVHQYEVDAYPHGKYTKEGRQIVPVAITFGDYISALRAKWLVEGCEMECDMHMVI